MNVWIYGKTNRTTSLLDQKTHIFDGDNFYEKNFLFLSVAPFKRRRALASFSESLCSKSGYREQKIHIIFYARGSERNWNYDRCSINT